MEQERGFPNEAYDNISPKPLIPNGLLLEDGCYTAKKRLLHQQSHK